MPSFAATSFARGGLSRSIFVQQDTTVTPTDRQYVEVAVTVHIDHARTVVMLVPDIDEVRAPILPSAINFLKDRRRALAGWARLCSPTTTSRSPSPSMSATSRLIGPTTLADMTCSDQTDGGLLVPCELARLADRLIADHGIRSPVPVDIS